MDEAHLQKRLEVFQSLMLKQIKSNEHKGDWNDKTVLELSLSLFKNLNKLMTHSLSLDWPGVTASAVDCANVAFFIADRTGICGG